MQEREQTLVRLVFDAQIIESVAAGKDAHRRRRVRVSGARLEKGRAALSEQIRVAQLVDRVSQIEPPQQRIPCHFGGTQDVASAVALDFGESEQFAHTPFEVAPDPAVNRPQHPIHARSPDKRHRDDTITYPSGAARIRNSEFATHPARCNHEVTKTRRTHEEYPHLRWAPDLNVSSRA